MHCCKSVSHSQTAALDPVRHSDLPATAPSGLFLLWRVRSGFSGLQTRRGLPPSLVVAKRGSSVMKLWDPGSHHRH